MSTLGDSGLYSLPLDSPATWASAVVPSDTDDLPGTPATSTSPSVPGTTRALYVGGTRDVRVRMRGGNDVTFAAVPTGTVLPIRVTRVFLTGTTATNIIAMR
jgi:hypothetical protein